MKLSVVVPTLNGRDQLAGCLDALAEHAPDAEVVVVNGPSADGTTGMVRDRDDVDVLVEIADRGLNVARNAGIDRATGDVVALLNHGLSVEEGWTDALVSAIAEADVVSGPTHRELKTGLTTESVETRTIKGRTVTYFNGDNAAFSRAALDALDGFDEYLQTGGSRDAAHRLAGIDYEVVWESDMCVRSEYGTDGGVAETDWNWKYRALAYRLAKNYGLRPTVVARMIGHGVRDAGSTLRDVAKGNATPSSWFGNGRDVLTGMGTGLKDGLVARFTDRSSRRNPRGRSRRSDRAVTVYDWR
ncbi:glycosyltransferase family 2 protein [Halorientalis brevis]|uniref:Glycosyltransferase family 2 protein n=1 Tax=Halorientalis brevis TaxID=1126241 RepID=A0ABD6C9N9_9EURY|nr:glycosyltransferase family A protein [Halorientalis brevis]